MLSPIGRRYQVSSLLSQLPAHYLRDGVWGIKGRSNAADRYTLVSPSSLTVNVNNIGLILSAAQELDLSVSASWDAIAPTDYTVAANRAGKDFYIYACIPVSGIAPKLLLSANSTYPSGYDASTSRKIGGFHCLCAAVGTISGHSLTDFAVGDILHESVWDLNHRPTCSPEGMVYSQQADLWVDIYLQSGTGVTTASVYGATITDTRDWNDYVDDLASVGKRLLDDAEFQVIAAGSNEETNIAGSADPVTTGAHLDTTSRRMISNIGVEDCCGVMWQWIRDQTYMYYPLNNTSNIGKTATLYHEASPGGNPIYLKYSTDGTPYLCCNMATDTEDKIITFGSAYTVRITHDASASSGGFQVYFNENVTTSCDRFLANLPGGKNEYVRTSSPNFILAITHNSSPSSVGVAVSYDDGTDERLEFTSPSSGNKSIDLASYSISSGYYDLPGTKGQLYRQGSVGDVKIRAGGSWDSASRAGSRCRMLYYCRYSQDNNCTSRGCAKHRSLQ